MLLNLHYCGGEIKAISLVKTDESNCCGDMEEAEEDGCCKDEVKFIKINELQSIAKKVTLNFLNFSYLCKIYSTEIQFTSLQEDYKENLLPLDHAPPNQIPLFITNRTLLI